MTHFALTFFLVDAVAGMSAEVSPPTSFAACRNPRQDPLPSDQCRENDSSNLHALLRTHDFIQQNLQSDFDRLAQHSRFVNALRRKVLSDLNQLKASYKMIADCPQDASSETGCAKAIGSLRLAVRKDWPSLLADAAIARPTQVDPGMMNTQEGWYTAFPSHLFHTSAKIAPLTPTARKIVEDTFLEKLKTHVPEIREALEAQKEGVRLVATNEREKISVQSAMVKIRDDARQAYLETVKKNPILTFIGEVDTDLPNSPSAAHLQAASQRFVAEIEKEIGQLSEDSQKSQSLLFSYKASAESLLRDNPAWCKAAETAADVFRMEQQSSDLKAAAIQIGASVFAMGTCSTVILCGAAAGVLGATDFHLIQSKADENFRRGMIQASTGDSKETLATSAAQNQSAGASLAIAAIGTVASGASAVKSATEKTTRALSTWDRVGNKTKTPATWSPRNAAEMQAYSSLHIREVRRNSVLFFQKNRELFKNATASQLKAIGKHDLEKVLDFKELSRSYGYKGIPKADVEDLLEYGDLVAKKSRDGKYIELSIADLLKMQWGHGAHSFSDLAKGAKTVAERKHWDAMLKVRHHVIESMEEIDGKIMADAYSKVHSPAARVELRLIEFISDLSARRANPTTVGEFGRPMIPTGDYIKKMGREKLAQKIAGSDSPMEIHAARRLLDRFTLDEIGQMALELEGVYKSSGLPTSLTNTILFRLHGR